MGCPPKLGGKMLPIVLLNLAIKRNNLNFNVFVALFDHGIDEFFYGPSRPLRYFKIGRKVKLKLREKQSYMKIKI